MKNSNPWAFGIVFILAVSIWAWNGFSLPSFFLSETIESTATVIERRIVIGNVLTKYRQRITFIYPVDGIWYMNSETIGSKWGNRFVGAQLVLTCLADDPNDYEIKGFLAGSDYNLGSSVFMYTGANGYVEIEWWGNVAKKTSYGGGGLILQEQTGLTTIIEGGDTLLFQPRVVLNKNQKSPLIIPDSLKNKFEQRFVMLFDGDDEPGFLMDVKNKRKYKEHM